MPAAPGMLGQPRQILAMAVKAQVTAAPVPCSLPAAREGEPGDHQVPGRVSHPARTRSRASTGTRCAHQRRMRHGAGPGQRGTWPASPGDALCRRHSRPSLRARRQATMPSMRPPRTRGGRRQPALPVGQHPARGVPGHRARGHAARRPGQRQGTAVGPQHHGHRAPDVAGPPRRRCPGLPAVSRLTGPDRQVVPSRHRRPSRSPFSCR
jgi:hypothetical protein